jgi:ubiquinone/menaquinone biosynthesis C-methylase UbiE
MLTRPLRSARVACGLALAFVGSVAAAGQLATRPVEEWVKVLDAPERLAALKVPEVVAALKLSPTDVVADLGAGTGPFVAAMAAAVPKGTLYAVEVDAKFLPYIQQKADAAGAKNVRTILGVFTDPQLPASDVDVAFMHDVFHHVEDRAGYVKALAKYLKPAGRIVVIDYKPSFSPHRGVDTLMVSSEEAKDILAAAGFRRVEETALFTDKWFLTFRR